MWRRFHFLLFLFLISITFIPVQHTDARRYGGYNSYSTYRPYKNSYNRQQTSRQNYATQRQSQAYATRQRNAQTHSYQRAASLATMQKGQAIRDRSRAIRSQMKERRPKGIERNTKRLQQQRKKMLDTQNSKVQGPQLAKRQKTIRDNQIRREQKKFKERQKKLDRLAKQRGRDKNNKKKKADQERAFRLAALASTTTTGFKPASFKPKTLSDFKSTRSPKKGNTKLASTLDKTHLAIRSKVEKAKKFRNTIFKPTKVLKTDKQKQQDRLIIATARAKSNFEYCSSGKCITTRLENRSTTGKTLADNKYFVNKIEYAAPASGTGYKYTVYQQEIDWNYKYKGKTNLERALNGNAPYIIKNGKPAQINLHHSRQNGRGSLFEITNVTHWAKRTNGGRALHPFGKSQHPSNPVNRSKFKIDRANYWLERAKKKRPNGRKGIKSG